MDKTETIWSFSNLLTAGDIFALKFNEIRISTTLVLILMALFETSNQYTVSYVLRCCTVDSWMYILEYLKIWVHINIENSRGEKRESE